MTSTGARGAHVDTGIPPTVDSAPKVCSPYVVGWILTAAGALGLAASLITDYREVSASRGSLISPVLQHQPRPQLWIGDEFSTSLDLRFPRIRSSV